MVGARFAEEVRQRDPNGRLVRLTVLGAEPRPAYNRVLLSTVLGGGLSAQAVRLHPPGWAARHRVDLRTGVTVKSMELPPERPAGKIIGEGVAAVPELIRLLQTEAKVL